MKQQQFIRHLYLVITIFVSFAHFSAFGQTNNPPIAQNDTFYTLKNTPLLGDVSLSDTDPDGNNLLFGVASLTPPSHGTIVNSPNGQFIYTPIWNYLGIDSFVYVVCDDGTPALCDTATVYINVQPIPFSTIDSITVKNTYCVYYPSGEITIDASSNSSLEYSIDSGTTWSSSNTFNNLYAGTYYIQVKTGNTIVNYANNPVIVHTVSATVDSISIVNAPSCDMSDGVISVHTTSAVPLEYTLDSISTFGVTSQWQSMDTFHNIRAGFYDLKIRFVEEPLCYVSTFLNYKISATNEPNLTGVSKTPTTNCTASDGQIIINATSTTGQALEYSINDGVTWSNNHIFNNLSPSVYFPKVRYVDGSCEVGHSPVSTVALASNNLPLIRNFEITSEHPSICGANDGSMFMVMYPASYSSNLQPFEFSIDSGMTWQTSGAFDNLTAGVYHPMTRVGNGLCAISYSLDSVVLTPSISPTISNIDYQQGALTILAHDTSVFSLEYSIDCGTTWQTSNVFHPVSSGNYCIGIRQTNGSCEVFQNIALLNTAPIAVNDTFNPMAMNPLPWNVLINDYDPNGDSIVVNTTLISLPQYGTATLDSTGLVTYVQTQGFNGLDSFMYQICEYGNNNPNFCDTATVYIISQFSALLIDTVWATDATCSLQNGSITIFTSGGLPSYEYSIDGGNIWQFSNVFLNLMPGVYNVTVRDATGTIVNYSTPSIVADIVSPTFISANYHGDTLTLEASTTNLLGLEYSIDCGASWHLSNKFYPVSASNICVGVRNVGGSCPIIQNLTITNTPPVAIDDTVYVRADTSQFNWASIRDSITNILDNDYDLENNQLRITIDSLIGPASYHAAILDSTGTVNYATGHMYYYGLTIVPYPYEVCEIQNPTNCDTGTFTVIIAPPSADSMNFIQDTIALSTSDSICLPTDELLGTPINISLLQAPIASNVINSVSNTTCLHYYGGFPTSADTFVFEICDEYGFCDTIAFELTVQDGVWPGDADDDTDVDNSDLLNIGLGYGWIGSVRDSITNNWNGYISQKWNVATPISNVDYRHIDCDGNGIINSDDTLAINLNYGKQYFKSGSGGVLGGTPLRVAVDTSSILPKFKFPITLGDANNPAANVYGGAFSIPYDTSIIKAESVYITFDTSWIGVKDVDMITLHRNNPEHQVVDAALTRIDGMNVNGFGIIGHLNFTIRDDILQRPGGYNADSVILAFDFMNVKFISNDETEIPIDILPSEITITSSNQILLGQYINVFPNPTSKYLNIQSRDLQINQFQIYDMTGKNVYNEVVTPKNNYLLQLNTFTSGLYTLQIHTDKGIAIKRIAVIR